MLDPTLMLFGSHLEAAIVFGGFLVYIIALSFFGYRDAKDKEEKKDVLAFLSVFGSMSVLSLGIVGLFGWWL